MSRSETDDSKAAPWLRWGAPVVALVFFAAAIFVVSGELRAVSWREVEAAAATTAPAAFLMALAALAVSLTAASTFDSLALATLGKPTPWRETRLVSALAFMLANAGGIGLAVAAAARYRAYQAKGVTGAETALISTVSAGVGLIGGLTLVGAGAAGSLADATSAAHLPSWLGVMLALFGLKALASYILAPRIGFLARFLASRRVRAGQVAASTVEWLGAAAILGAFLPMESPIDLLHLIPVFGLAGLLGAFSGLPGGIGVFDAVILAVLGPKHGAAEVAAALLLYRLIYVVGPLLAAGVLSAGQLGAERMRASPRAMRAGQEAWLSVSPGLFGLLTFASGVVMLISVATPDAAPRLRLLSALAPTGLVETSHFAASLAGVALLFLAFGVKDRLRRAYVATLVVLLAAAVATLAKGLNYEEAGFLAAVAGLLFLSRAAFYRQAGLRAAPLKPSEMAAIAAVLIATAWLGLFAYQHVEYRDELWWTFVTDHEAPRFLRASVGVAVLALMLTVWRLTSPTPPLAHAPTQADLDAAARVLAAAEGATPDANLAFLGDKTLLFSESGLSFVQYAARGSTWVAMGEPVGPADERRAMIWAFRDLCDRRRARPVFYAVRRDSLADFVDCGFVATKIGENAVVGLADFGLEGSHRASLRQAYNRAEREGVAFEVVPPEGFDAMAAELRGVSDAWLGIHHGEEKGFSLGRFDPAYLRRFPTAVMRRDGAIVAFANLWRTPDGKTLSIDLMRYSPQAPKNIMDALFVHLMLWGKAQGFADFDMGMAPLAGLETHRLARTITRLSAFAYEEAGSLYGFEGLRAFKSKFGPRWEGSYIAAPSGWLLGPALGDVALLSSGGVMGLLK